MSSVSPAGRSKPLPTRLSRRGVQFDLDPAVRGRAAGQVAELLGLAICRQIDRHDRQCVEPHVTEVIELPPPEVIVRRDICEQLACAACEGEPVRAPAGETVVPNGKLNARRSAAVALGDQE